MPGCSCDYGAYWSDHPLVLKVLDCTTLDQLGTLSPRREQTLLVSWTSLFNKRGWVMRIIFLCYAMQAVCEKTALLLPKHVSLPSIQYGCLLLL